MSLTPLPDVILTPLVDAALAEDLGAAGDITSRAVIPAESVATFEITAREPGVIAGLDLARLAFTRLDPWVELTPLVSDGTLVTPGAHRGSQRPVLARVSGPTASLLGAERVALNYVGHLSGIATATRQLVDAVAHTSARICCTRKTTPGLRALEKYAVRAGGGSNHRFGLDDAVLIKDNHVAIAGSVSNAVRRAQAGVGHLVAIEVEVDTLQQLEEVLRLPGRPVAAVMLDNFSPEQVREAVRAVDGRFRTEASGRVTLETVAEIAETGVDLISAGWITHSAPVLDVGLDA